MMLVSPFHQLSMNNLIIRISRYLLSHHSVFHSFLSNIVQWHIANSLTRRPDLKFRLVIVQITGVTLRRDLNTMPTHRLDTQIKSTQYLTTSRRYHHRDWLPRRCPTTKSFCQSSIGRFPITIHIHFCRHKLTKPTFGK